MKTSRYLQSVHGALAEGAQAQLDLALSGDALAARRLMLVAPRRLRGHIASLAYHLRTKNPAYREILKGVWAADTRHLLTAHWPQQTLRRMLARAEFPRPDLSGPITIYRAVSKVPVKKAAAGLCWSLSRERATAEAVRADAANARILQAQIEPADIIYWGNSRGEQEVVPRHPIEAFLMESVSPERPPANLRSPLGRREVVRSAAARGRTRRRA
jgi:hypothetical protein